MGVGVSDVFFLFEAGLLKVLKDVDGMFRPGDEAASVSDHVGSRTIFHEIHTNNGM